MTITTKIKKVKNLSVSEKKLINRNRLKEFGSSAVVNFNKDYEPNTLFFFFKKDNKIVSFGALIPITIDYLDKRYRIFGFVSGIALEKGKGYGKISMLSRINYLKKRGKTGLGFCVRKNWGFFKKCGLKTKKNFIKRFIYKNPKTGEEIIDNEGDGIYYEGKDNFIKKVLSTKSPVYINIPHW